MSCNLSTLLSQACANQFLQLANTDPKAARAAILQLLCNISTNGISSGIQSQSVALDSTSTVYIVPHGLGRIPTIVRAVFVVTNLDVASGYGTPLELELPGSWFPNQSGGAQPQVYADSSNVYLSITQKFVGNEATWFVIPRVGGPAVNPTSFNNFKLKFYFG